MQNSCELKLPHAVVKFVAAESDAQPSEQRQKCLFRILKAYANLCPDVGYCQLLMSFQSPEMITSTTGVICSIHLPTSHVPSSVHIPWPVQSKLLPRCSEGQGMNFIVGLLLLVLRHTESICRGSFRMNNSHRFDVLQRSNSDEIISRFALISHSSFKRNRSITLDPESQSINQAINQAIR